jgi:hypothetical protein
MILMTLGGGSPCLFLEPSKPSPFSHSMSADCQLSQLSRFRCIITHVVECGVVECGDHVVVYTLDRIRPPKRVPQGTYRWLCMHSSIVYHMVHHLDDHTASQHCHARHAITHYCDHSAIIAKALHADDKPMHGTKQSPSTLAVHAWARMYKHTQLPPAAQPCTQHVLATASR